MTKIKVSILGLMLVFTSVLSFGQVKSAKDYTRLYPVVKQQADAMAQAFVKGDYKAFVKFANPRLTKSMGGQAKMLGVLDSAMKTMKAMGVAFSSIQIDAPTKIVKNNNELQCLLSQHSKLKIPTGGVTATSTLIAISADEGKSWTFVDTSNKDIESIKRLLPDLSTQLVIPPNPKPVFGS